MADFHSFISQMFQVPRHRVLYPQRIEAAGLLPARVPPLQRHRRSVGLPHAHGGQRRRGDWGEHRGRVHTRLPQLVRSRAPILALLHAPQVQARGGSDAMVAPVLDDPPARAVLHHRCCRCRGDDPPLVPVPALDKVARSGLHGNDGGAVWPIFHQEVREGDEEEACMKDDVRYRVPGATRTYVQCH